MVMAKKTSKNQITLPKAVIEHFPDIEYFDVEEDRGRIILSPVLPSRADEVRDRLEQLGITERDVDDAVAWAREG